MSKTKTDTAVAKRPTATFEPGHPRFGGRAKRKSQHVRDMAACLGIEPMEYLLKLLTVDSVEEISVAPDGTERKVKVPVTHGEKVEICRVICGYFYPKLSTTELTGENGGPVAVAALDMNKLLADPIALEAAQTLSLKLSGFDIDVVPGMPAPTQRKNLLGHYQDVYGQTDPETE